MCGVGLSEGGGVGHKGGQGREVWVLGWKRRLGNGLVLCNVV